MSIIFDGLPKLGLLITVPSTLGAIVGGVALVLAGQWALGVVLLLVAAGLGFLSFKLWQFLQPAD